jgi:dipeptidyl aminopeptidase/acylaminoacyl peptidase
MRKPLAAIAAFVMAVMPLAAHSQGRGFTADDMVNLARVSEPQLSPDGKTLLYVLRETDRTANRGRTDLFMLDVSRAGAAPVRLAADPASESNPRWSKDGKQIWFLSSRSGSSQLWVMQADGSSIRQVTNSPVDLGGFAIAPTGDRVAFWADVFPQCTDLACTRDRLAASAKSPETGQVYDRLFVRHWDTWKNGTRSALFTQALDGSGKVTGDPVKVSRGLDGDVPSKPFGGAEEVTFTPDGKSLIFTLREAGTSEPWSTNLDLFRVPADGSAAPVNLTADNKATDTHPLVSPDGKSLVYLAMRRPTFEADRQYLMVKDLATGATRTVGENWDRSIDSFAFTPDGKAVVARAGDTGTTRLFRITLDKGEVTALTTGGSAADFAVGPRRIVFAWHDLKSPADFYQLTGRSSAPQRLTSVNAERLAGIAMGATEQISFPGWNNQTVHAWVIKPANFDPAKRYPVAFLVHGGPQASFSDQWHYRWNAQVYAGAGYAVVMVDFHGSTGYGQAFTDSISQDWGGKPLEDLKKGLDAALARSPWMDANRMCALGGSYGGYMMSWIASQWRDRFKCLVNHAGIFDNRAMYYSTEELWFVEWEHGGPYFANPDQHEKHNPVRFADQWITPQLVIHGLKDYRVPYTQGLAIYTALQRRGIASRLLIFPDENHWILKPANSVQWHSEVLRWLDQWTKP